MTLKNVYVYVSYERRKLWHSYVSVTDWTAVARRAFTHKHVESIQTGATISTGIRLALINLHFTPARHKIHAVSVCCSRVFFLYL